MAFPVVAAVNASHEAVSGSHTCNLPAGIVSGDLLIAAAFCSLGTQAISWPAGWSVLDEGASYGSEFYFSVRYRIADGTEGSSISLSSGGGTLNWASRSWRITGAVSSAPEATASAPSGSDTTPDPPSLSPSWGALDTLWIALFGQETGSGGQSVTAYPTNYSSNQHGDFQNNAGHGSAERNLNAATEDPGTFTTTVNARWRAVTVAVRPLLFESISDVVRISDLLTTTLRSYRIDATPALLSDLILASVLVPPKLLTDTQVLADSVLRVLHQYRLVTDTAALSDALVFAIQSYRGLLDSASPSSDRILATVLQRDTVSSNRAKPISRPRWLFDANIGGTQRFSSEDLEKP